MPPKRASSAAAAGNKAAAVTNTKPVAKPAKQTATTTKAAATKPVGTRKVSASAKPEPAKNADHKPAAKKRAATAPAAKEPARKRKTSEEPQAIEAEEKPKKRQASEKPAAAASKKANSVKPRKASVGPNKKAAKAKSVEPEADKENDNPADDASSGESKQDAPKEAPKEAPKASSGAATKRKRTPAHEEPAAEPANAIVGAAEKAVSDKAATPPEEPEKEEARPAKRAKTVATAPAYTVKIGKKINSAPEAILDVFVFGEGSSGELGLGSVRHEGKKPIDVKRPRINHNLSAAKVGVVQISCGGMHSVALTKDGKILTWGVNDQGALGRDTKWDGGLRDMDAEDSDDDDDDSGLNPRESTPTEVDTSEVAAGTKFVQVVASDSASFALTEDGRIYGWGTFRASDGVMGFTPNIRIQPIPMLLPEPKKVVQIAAGSNHVMSLDSAGKLMTWGCPEQNQLGRRCVQREMISSALRPGGVGLKRGVKVVKIACGSYHSFALDSKGAVYAWGLNNFGELGMPTGAGDSDAAVLSAALVESLRPYKVADICGGEHHSVACTEDGKLLTWGRIDGHQVGLPTSFFNEENAIYDESGKPRILKEPTVIPDVPKIVSVAAGTDNSFALTDDGKAYSWGFSTNYQTGQGTSEDIEVPTLIDNTAVRGKKLIFAGAGGQYSVLAAARTALTNGSS